MSEEWLAANLKYLEYEELQELDSMSSKVRYSAIGTFVVSLFPQYSLIEYLRNRNPGKRSLKVKFFIGTLFLMRYVASTLVSYPFKVSQEQFIEQLNAKYPEKNDN